MRPQPEDPYRDQHGMVMMCMHCHRTLRRIPPGQNGWELVPRFVRKRPVNVSDGLCGECLEKHYPKS